MKPIELIIVGAGSRGNTYANFALAHPDRARVVGVAEPRLAYRQQMAEKHDLANENTFTNWQDIAARDKLADVAIIATQDAMHVGPAVALAEKGYHILLEKPMAPNPDDCRRIVEAAITNDIIFAVCHVMRYTPYTQQLKTMLNANLIGDIVTIQHLEPVGYWHQAHSFVRGNWRNQAESSPMLLAKSCHDLDWLRYIVGQPCRKVSSFGNLKHFKKANKPLAAGEALRCLDCAYEPDCPYSARRFYLGRLAQGETEWPLNVLTPTPTVESITEALQNGPYGRCVYECDNDVVDHQVVNLEFEDDITATFTMTAFSGMPPGRRKTRIFGTLGEIYSDEITIEHFDFRTDQKQIIAVKTQGTALAGHGGGDLGLMEAFISAIETNNPGKILSGPQESLETHLMVFAAEEARHKSQVVEVVI